MDLETCSRCLVEEEWEDLHEHPDTGENLCGFCLFLPPLDDEDD